MSKTFIQRLRDFPTADAKRSYKMGRDCAKHGANTTNCHFSLFQNKDCTTAWELGKEDESRKEEERLRS